MNKVITGASQGIGKGLAMEFARQGHNVVVAARSQQILQQLADDINQLGAQALPVACDTQDCQQVLNLWQQAVNTFGQVDVWINNAGIARTTWSIADTPQDQIEAMVNTNIIGTINGCRVAAKNMSQQGFGKIINVLGGGSDGEYFPGMGIYGTTKRALDYFTNALVKELKDTPVVVAKVRPGMVITEGMVREAQTDPKKFQQSRRFANILCDYVEDVAPYLVEQILACQKSGSKIAWLNGWKITKRMLLAKLKQPQDKFARFGL
ncbi:SDR family NAD(P)-dependent oxidoreductase [Paraferrimonas sedimenticola]|uniref:Beta-ketoacyl-ACP reductase n=1 Tax=Paraferrimonas sedimenticola TaxID=375674 RepID=A0AA37RVZ3_9GAMM|nr:SDR family oxidoreductase [Paraferrimonas sedimenticola]GLP96334.1 beta-ketoacyl-ACP reductase [Paraferrimonas sedimenticola]